MAAVDDFMETIRNAGGKVLTEQMAIPGVGYIACCQDTKGSTFGIFQEL